MLPEYEVFLGVSGVLMSCDGAMSCLRHVLLVFRQRRDFQRLRQSSRVVVLGLLIVSSSACIGPSLTSIPTVGGGSSAGAGSDTSVSASCPSTGTAVVGDVLATKTFVNSSGAIATGTMTNHGAFNLTGAFSGAGYVSSLTGLATSEVCSTTSILGSAGTAVCQGAAGSGTIAAAGQVCSGHYAYNASGTAVNGSATCPGVGSPANVAGLVLWLRADTHTLSDNDKLTFVSDASSKMSHLVQLNLGNRPTYKTNVVNSHPVFRFSSASSTYVVGPTDAALPTGSAARTLFAVFKVNNAATDEEILGWGGVNAGQQRIGLYHTGSASRIGMEFAGSGSNVATLNDTNFHIASYVYQAGSAINDAANVFYLDGTAGSALAASSGATLATSDGLFEIGRIVNVGMQYFTGDVAEVIVYSSALGNPNREAIECYLSTKYSITIGHGC